MDLEDIINQMSNHGITGLTTGDVMIDGKIHRFKPDDARSKVGWYILFEFYSESGERLVSGSFGDWRFDTSVKIKVKGQSKLSDEEKRRFRQEQKQRTDDVKRERESAARAASGKANKLWQRLSEDGESSYLKCKHVRGYGVRYGKNNTIIIPLHDQHDRIFGLQVIYGEKQQSGSDKEFWPPGLAKKGHYFRIGKPPSVGNAIVVCEGYATGASIHEATGITVIVAFDCGNLEPVTKTIRRVYPKCNLIIAGDDDYLTEKPINNPGKVKAEEVADKYKGVAVVPSFKSRTNESKWTDFNDLHVNESLDEVKKQITWSVEKKYASLHSDEGHVDKNDWSFSLSILNNKFVLIYSTETVFDERIGRILTLASLRAAAGKDVVRLWLESNDRRIVDKECVLFDPSMKCNPKTTVNLFRGWPVKPVQGQCDRTLELLEYLCGADSKIVDWVLKWIAYPLQNPGSKMRTAIIMHGPEGTGKNEFWRAVRDIYDKYSGIITQTELESQFNGWASGKMFIIGNEVVSRQEMYHQKGRLKNMITEPVWAINEKMLPVRMEENHANFVLLSNAIQPATPDKDDRRFLVIWTPPALSAEFYQGVATEIDSGGVAAFYNYLLNISLGDFSPHAKPPSTTAKQDLIEAAMDSHERFWREWKSNQLMIPFAPCLTEQLYQAYTKWCAGKGERPARDAVFGSAMAKRIKRETKRYINDSDETKQQRFYIPHGL